VVKSRIRVPPEPADVLTADLFDKKLLQLIGTVPVRFAESAKLEKAIHKSTALHGIGLEKR
jgi:hypothetical protein